MEKTKQEKVYRAFLDMICNLAPDLNDEGLRQQFAERMTEFSKIWGDNFGKNPDAIDKAQEDITNWVEENL